MKLFIEVFIWSNGSSFAGSSFLSRVIIKERDCFIFLKEKSEEALSIFKDKPEKHLRLLRCLED